MLTALQQAKKLATIGYPQDKIHQFKYNDVGKVIELGSAERMYNIGEEWNAPTIHEALEWFREEKGIICWVQFEYNDGAMWYGTIIQKDEQMTPLHTESFANHSLAESALLDEVMKYVEDK